MSKIIRHDFARKTWPIDLRDDEYGAYAGPDEDYPGNPPLPQPSLARVLWARFRLWLARITIALAAFALASTLKAEELPDEAVESLALQYMYMELCKDFPPLPPDRLRTVDTMTEMVDKEQLKKATLRLTIRLKLQSPTKVTEFCSRMATMIKDEQHEE